MSLRRGKVLLAMSGGVDSSVAAALLLRTGYEVVGCFMRLGSPGEALDQLSPDDADGEERSEADGEDDCGADACASRRPGNRQASQEAARRPVRLRIGHQGCCSINDAADARLVAARLGIPFYVCNFKREFGRVIDHFVQEYNAGRTPNPCVRCNDWLKFGKLHEYAMQVDADYVASGHYARIDAVPNDGPRLRRGVDVDKDQSYVLFGVPRERLSRMLLPIGELRKAQVRAIARELDLPVFDKPDSQEICFVPDNDYAGLVRRRTPDGVRSGPLRHVDGRTLGEHPGQQHFTVGQRRRLGVATGAPLYVLERDAATNTVTVGPREALAFRGCVASEVNWLAEPLGSRWRRCAAQIRAHGPMSPAQARLDDDGRLEVRFDAPVFAVAPGQAVVLYHGDVVLGGGWIDRGMR